MSKKLKAREALQFYIENDLCEIFSELPQNNFLLQEKKVAVKNVNIEPEIIAKKSPSFFSNSAIQSGYQAISHLAQKTNNMQNNSQQNEQFKSLNEILAEAKKLAAKAKTLPELRKIVENFDGCNLKKMATNTVFCDGNANSKVMVIGEAPGNHEDLQGIPFCGDSGKVLDEMFGAINMKRADNFYITNVIFWRPPGNRRPTDEELAICRPFVERHIELMQPEVLVLVGATAMSAILGINDPVTGVRGKFMDFSPKFLSKKIKTFTIFHPSYLMRQPMKKKVAWQDMLELESFLAKF